ncbi:MAG: LamG-like jellyroll fold domain-containing protein [Flavobacteriales bacterium]
MIKYLLTFLTGILLLNSMIAQLPSYLPSNGLVGWWPFNGNANDESGNENVLNNYFVQFTIDSQRGTVANFNGNSWLESDTSIFHSVTPITYCFWAKTSSNYAMDIISQSCGNECGDDMRVQLNVAQCGYSGLSYFSPAFYASAPGNTSDTNWHFFTIVLGSNGNYSYNNFQFYIDGVFIAIGPTQCSHNWGGWTYNPNTTYPLTIGKGMGVASYFNGLLDDIALYNRSLSTQEIISLFNSSASNNYYGCTESNACNYDPIAINDDGSCVYPLHSYLTCEGTCIHDTNTNGVCDELETDPQQSNLSNIPHAISYQAIARTNQDQPLIDTNMQVRFTLLTDSLSGASEYVETQALTTNEFGLFTTSFGTGTPITGTFSAINWASGNKYLKVELDAGGGFIHMGTQQLLSVPYALRSKSAGEIENDSLPVYPNNAAAIAGGLTVGKMYRTASGDLKVAY